MNNMQFPTQLIQMIKGGNPQQILSNMLQQNTNPMAQNIIGLINNQDNKGIEQLARNICASKGIDADELMNNVKNQNK